MMSQTGEGGPWEQWRAALAGPRLHHAWLLAGKRGLGKSAFADRAARELLAQEGLPTAAGDHPDIIRLVHPPKDDKEAAKRDEGKPYEVKRNIPIDLVRSMQQRLTTRPTLGDRRVIIVDPADDMEKNAANALLKSLEEPPSGTFFLLVSHQPARLLPTIRSRCRVLRFSGLPDAEVESLVARSAPEAESATIAAAVAAAAGSPGVALRFVELELGKIDELVRQILSRGDPDFALRGKLAAEIGTRPDRERIQAILDLARAIVAEQAPQADRALIPPLVKLHGELVALAAQAPIYNFDAGLLAMEIGTLLAAAAPASERAHV